MPQGFSAELHPDDAAFEKFGRGDVEKLGDFFAAAFEGLRIGGDEVGDDLGGLDGEVFQSGDPGAVGTAFYGWLLFFSGGGLLRCVHAG